MLTALLLLVVVNGCADGTPRPAASPQAVPQSAALMSDAEEGMIGLEEEQAGTNGEILVSNSDIDSEEVDAPSPGIAVVSPPTQPSGSTVAPVTPRRRQRHDEDGLADAAGGGDGGGGGVMKEYQRREPILVRKLKTAAGESIKMLYNAGTAVIMYTSSRVILRESTDGNHMVMSIWNPNGTKLQDCDVTRNHEQMDELLENFQTYMQRSDAVEYVQHQDSLSWPTIYSFKSFNSEQSYCHQWQTKLLQAKKDAEKSAAKKTHRRQKRFAKIYNLVKSAYSGVYSMLQGVFPGTLWCGKGSVATSRNALGEEAEADKCCRQHDTECGQFILAGKEKFNIRNPTKFNIPHCSCDRRFNQCLRNAGTEVANQIGRLYFRYYKMPCYNLKYKRRCIKLHWGECHRYRLEPVAQIVKGAIPFASQSVNSPKFV